MMNWRKIGVGLLVSTLTIGLASAEGIHGMVRDGNGNVIGTSPNHYPPYYGGSPSFGGCNKDNTFCWNITLPPSPPSGPYYTYPIEVYGEQAQVIVERGHIIDRRFSWSGWRYLVKTGWQSWFQFKNKTFDCSVSRHQPTEYFCEEWTPQDRW